MVVAEANLRYLAACRFEDDLVVSAFVARVGTTSVVLDFEIHRGAEPVATGTLRYVFVDPKTLMKTPPPPEVRKAYYAHLPA
jgi:acyl-CoA thioester hydrolase